MTSNSVDQDRHALPNGWELKTIGEISNSINPGFPSGKHNQEGLGVPHIRPMNISRNGEIELSQVKYVQETAYTSLMNGDVLFNNTNSPELVGKTTFIPKDTDWAYSNHMTRIRLRKEIADPAWVAKCLHYLFLDGFFKLNCRHHVNQASISSGFLSEQVAIPVPPLPEQHRIVSRIEELFSDLDAGVAALDRVRAGLKRYRASVLKAAFEGRLVEQDPQDQHAGILYQEILERRMAYWKSKSINQSGKARAKNYAEAELPDAIDETLPEGWVWASLDGLAFRITYGITVRPKYLENGIPIISAREIRSGEVDVAIAHKIGEQDFAKLRSNCILQLDDILFSKTGTIGHVARVKVTVPLSVSQNVAVISPVVWPEYLEMALRSPQIQRRAQNQVKTTAVSDLQLGLMKKFPIPLPPLSEQRRIIAEVERRLSVAQQVDAAVDVGLARAARLRQAVLKAAFEGRL